MNFPSRMADASGLSIAEMKRRNEAVSRDEADVEAGVARIWSVMNGMLPPHCPLIVMACGQVHSLILNPWYWPTPSTFPSTISW